MLTFVGALLSSPLVRGLIYVLVVVLAFGGGIIKGRVAEHTYMVVEQQKEAANAVAEADAARAAAAKKFSSGKFNNRPGLVPGRVHHGSDGFARD